eukprot:6655894-Karenia_brevis.AAC.1
MVWTADGRPHAAVMRTLAYAADIAARRQGGIDKAGFLARWKHELSVAILRRRAAMARACLPRKTAREMWLLTGSALHAGCNGRWHALPEESEGEGS